jgi:energy-coupling factor transporter transmembrane protein EcfT
VITVKYLKKAGSFMVQYIPMIILMSVFGVIGLYWAIGAHHFIAWTRKYQNTFPKFSDHPAVGVESGGAVGVESGGAVGVESGGAVGAKASSSFLLNLGIRLTGLVLTGVAAASIIHMIMKG